MNPVIFRSRSGQPGRSLVLTVTVIFLLALGARTFDPSVLAGPQLSDRLLVIAESASGLPGGKAVLSITPLQRTGDTYNGDYQVKVYPYFFKSESGKLAICVPSEAVASVSKGVSAEITGTATTKGESRARRIEATATPVDNDHGALTLWFMAGDRKMTFNTSYRFASP